VFKSLIVCSVGLVLLSIGVFSWHFMHIHPVPACAIGLSGLILCFIETNMLVDE